MRVLALDPGTYDTGWCLIGPDKKPMAFGISPNGTVLDEVVWNAGANLLNSPRNEKGIGADVLVIEQVAHMSMAVGRDVFETVYWSGRFAQSWVCSGMDESTITRIPRTAVKIHLCGSARAKDRNISAALKDRWGGELVAVGGKKCPRCKGRGWFGAGRPVCPDCDGARWQYPPGPLHGLTSHALAAYAVGLTYTDTKGDSNG